MYFCIHFKYNATTIYVCARLKFTVPYTCTCLNMTLFKLEKMSKVQMNVVVVFL